MQEATVLAELMAEDLRETLERESFAGLTLRRSDEELDCLEKVSVSFQIPAYYDSPEILPGIFKDALCQALPVFDRKFISLIKAKATPCGSDLDACDFTQERVALCGTAGMSYVVMSNNSEPVSKKDMVMRGVAGKVKGTKFFTDMFRYPELQVLDSSEVLVAPIDGDVHFSMDRKSVKTASGLAVTLDVTMSYSMTVGENVSHFVGCVPELNVLPMPTNL